MVSYTVKIISLKKKNNNDFIDRIQSGVKNIDSDEKKLVKTGVKVALCALFAGIVAAVAMPIPILMVPASIILVGGASALYQAWQSGSPLITSLNNL